MTKLLTYSLSQPTELTYQTDLKNQHGGLHFLKHPYQAYR